jgi:hypothetical protein
MLPKLLREEAELDKSEFADLTAMGELVFIGLTEPDELAFVEVVALLNPGFCNNVVTGLLGLRPRLNAVDIL